MRHAETSGNLRHAYIGRTDEPLCAEGRASARRAGVLPSITRVVVSPLLRARQTASICFPNAEQIVAPGLREMDFGDFEGRSALEMEDDPDYRLWLEGLCEPTCPNGESRALFCRRTAAAFEQILAQERARNEQRLVIVAHGGTIMALMSRFAIPHRGYFDWHVGSCGGFRALVKTGAPGEGPTISQPTPFDSLDSALQPL